MPVASTMANVSVSSIGYSTVSSKTMMTAAIGARRPAPVSRLTARLRGSVKGVPP
jgi:hypothetical protein